MKRILFVVLLLIASTTLFAQKGKVSTALTLKDEGKLDKAWAAIQETVDPANPKAEKSLNWSGTWEARGQILDAIINSKKPRKSL